MSRDFQGFARTNINEKLFAQNLYKHKRIVWTIAATVLILIAQQHLLPWYEGAAVWPTGARRKRSGVPFSNVRPADKEPYEHT